ncbi:hypothetical protein ACQPXH_15800 [Nocardia sp. CA-135953]|uniref:hypothetical protein n=1 Tax=Nocardia sp. CA-135953 TaxID=3239978 RepID=UPI003D97AF0A
MSEKLRDLLEAGLVVGAGVHRQFWDIEPDWAEGVDGRFGVDGDRGEQRGVVVGVAVGVGRGAVGDAVVTDRCPRSALRAVSGIGVLRG